MSTTNQVKVEGVSERLLQLLTKVAGKESNPAQLLQKILHIGKDAAYRRLRGEVSFSLDEIIVIGNELDICLDSVIYGVETKKAIFDFEDTHPGRQTPDTFIQRLEAHTELWSAESKRLTAACPSLPEFILLRFPRFTRFNLFAGYASPDVPYDKFLLSEEFKKAQTAYNTAFATMKRLELIFDDNLLVSIIKEIAYFVRLGVLSAKEAEELNTELLLILDVLERAAQTGIFPGTKTGVAVYLSHTEIGTEIWLLESETKAPTAWLSPYPGKSIRTQNGKVCRNHRIRIDEIKRFSTYITRSGEATRREFFNKLRRELKVES